MSTNNFDKAVSSTPPNLMGRRAFLASAAATAVLAISGCSLQKTEAPVASTSKDAPSHIDDPTSDYFLKEDFTKEDLTFDKKSTREGSLAPLHPKPNGQQLILAQIGDSKVNSSRGLPYYNKVAGTDRLTGLSRWQAGLDPQFNSMYRPCTTNTSIYDKNPVEWMPKAFKRIMGLPINGVIVNVPMGIYAYQGGPHEKGSDQAKWYETACGVIQNMREMVQMTYKKTQTGIPMALTFLHPVELPIPGANRRTKDFDPIRVNEDMLELMQELITDVVPGTSLLRLSVNSGWWSFIKDKIIGYDGDTSRLSTLFDSVDKDFGFFTHPAPDGEKFYYGDLIVREYEDMDRFVRRQAGLPKG